MDLLREKFSLRFQLGSSTHYQRKESRLDQFLDISLNGLKTIIPKCVSKGLPLYNGCRFGTHPITRNHRGFPLIQCRGHAYRLVITA